MEVDGNDGGVVDDYRSRELDLPILEMPILEMPSTLLH